jgi:hypothetical protein
MRDNNKLELQHLIDVLVDAYLGWKGIMDARRPIGERGNIKGT